MRIDYYKDIIQPFDDLSPEELKELIKKLEEESKNLTDWPPID